MLARAGELHRDPTAMTERGRMPVTEFECRSVTVHDHWPPPPTSPEEPFVVVVATSQGDLLGAIWFSQGRAAHVSFADRLSHNTVMDCLLARRNQSTGGVPFSTQWLCQTLPDLLPPTLLVSPPLPVTTEALSVAMRARLPDSILAVMTPGRCRNGPSATLN